jgi:ATP-dependent RNA helicase DDX19/DBP5
MGFRKPSKVQEKTLPLLMINPPQNMIGQSQSGTGKTAAFVLNILHRIDLSTEQACKTPQALVLAPSRELARQILGVIKVMGIQVPGLLADLAVPTEASQRSRKIEAAVVVGTPGTVMDMIRRRSMDARAVKILVLDEADNMLDQQGLGDQCTRVKGLVTTFPTVYNANIQPKLASKGDPDRPLFRYFPRTCRQVCHLIRWQC